MLAISVPQPSADLIMARCQLLIYRAFPPKLNKEDVRGAIIIHADVLDPKAAASDPKLAKTTVERAILGTVDLVDVLDKLDRKPDVDPDAHYQALLVRLAEHFPKTFHDDDIAEFDDWWASDRRYAWVVNNPVKYASPIAQRGRPGIWEFTPPAQYPASRE